ncbi:MAG: hypothetical protein Q8R78_01720 [Candidatus Omnitrophota bacterium]|nr:hypothetical protein [Candidatus Omnitrophota bacterium]
MKTVWKYPIPVAGLFTLEMPAGAEVLSVQIQRGNPMLWTLVETDFPKRERAFRIVGTGHELLNANELEFRGTFQVRDESEVFHLFEYTQ